MSDSKTHYEVHGKQSGSWIVQKVCDEKENAIDFAKTLKAGQNTSSVKVLQVKFDSSNPVFINKEVYFDGERDTSSSKNAVDLIEPVCRSSSDLSLPEARRVIWQLLQKPLAGWQIIPLELLYHHGHLQKLNDTGQILQGAVQRVAISQVQKTGQNVNDRVLDLYKITDDALAKLRELSAQDKVPEIENDNLIKMARVAKEQENWRQLFLMSMARYFKNIRTVDEKFEKIFDWLGLYDDPDVLEMLDRYVADFMGSSVYLQRILGDEENLGEAMLGLVDFIRGARTFKTGAHKGAIRINALLRDQFLPETRIALTARLLDTLRGNASFVVGNPYKSVLYHSRLLAKTRIAKGGHIGGQEVLEALKNRSEKMTGSATLSTMMEGDDEPLDRVDKFLKICEGLVGSANKRTIANFLLPVLESQKNIQQIISQNESPLGTIARLRELQESTRSSDFQEYYAAKIIKKLDEIGTDLLTSYDILGGFKKQAQDNTQLGLSLVQLLASNKLTEPGGLHMVREYTKKTIVSGDFMAALEEKAKAGASQVEFFKTFYKALEKTDIR